MHPSLSPDGLKRMMYITFILSIKSCTELHLSTWDIHLGTTTAILKFEHIQNFKTNSLSDLTQNGNRSTSTEKTASLPSFLPAQALRQTYPLQRRERSKRSKRNRRASWAQPRHFQGPFEQVSWTTQVENMEQSSRDGTGQGLGLMDVQLVPLITTGARTRGKLFISNTNKLQKERARSLLLPFPPNQKRNMRGKYSLPGWKQSHSM